MLPRKPRKPKAVEYDLCPECGAVKRYAVCVHCGWVDEETKEKDKEIKKLISKNNARRKPKIKKKPWGEFGERK